MARKRRGKSYSRVTARSQPRAIPSKRKKDPFDYLNEHCLGFVLHFLDPVDIISCETVSVKWRDLIRGWISVFGIRLHFPMLWTRGRFIGQDPAFAIEHYKKLGMTP